VLNAEAHTGTEKKRLRSIKMSIKEDIRKIGEQFDLTKKYPNYFNKKLFRTTTIIMFILFGIGFVTNDYKFTNIYATCNSETKCPNPFYLCSNIDMTDSQFRIGTGHTCLPSINYKTKPLCDAGLCNQEYLEPHETIGNPPNFFNQYFALWLIILYLITITINHYLYKRTKTK